MSEDYIAARRADAMTPPDLAEKLGELRILLAERQELHRKLMETDPLIGLIAAAHRDRATLDDHQVAGASLTPPPSLAPICAELGLSPGEDVGAIVAAIRAVRDEAVAKEREACAMVAIEHAGYASNEADDDDFLTRIHAPPRMEIAGDIAQAIRARPRGGEG